MEASRFSTIFHRHYIRLAIIVIWSHIMVQNVLCYKPVILVHGVLDNGRGLADIKKYIEDAHPGTNVTSLELYDDIMSLTPLDKQISDFISKVRPIMQAAEDGVHLVCHSQGGLICRGIVEMMDDHKVDTLITLSSPLFGQFGIPPSWLKYLPYFENLTRDEVSRLVYTPFLQSYVSVANYWRDPRPQFFQEFEKNCKYLPALDNNPNAAKFDQKVALKQKQNFLKLERMVTLGGPDDGVIDPWQSSSFEYLSTDAAKIVPLQEQPAYVEDWFGLRKLDERGGLTRYIVSGIEHQGWHHDINIFNKYIKQWLD